MDMKVNKITLIAQAIGMYVMHIPLYIFFIVGLLSSTDEAFVLGLIKTSLILMAIVLPICIANAVLSIISIFKGNIDISKTVMKVKLALIPWYVINFAMCVILVAVMLNPFMMIGIPVVVALAIVAAYFCMVITSLPDVAYYLRKVFIEKEEQITSQKVVTIVFLFIFCLDIVGAIRFYRENKKTQFESSVDPTPSQDE